MKTREQLLEQLAEEAAERLDQEPDGFTPDAQLALGGLGREPEPIDTSELSRDDYAFVVGALITRIELRGHATRADAKRIVAQAIERRTR